MVKIGTLISTWLFCTKVGADSFGNSYFLSKCKNSQGTKKRVVIYKGISEPSKIPPMWHSWLHYRSNEVPQEDPSNQTYSWIKPYLPNLTGTTFSHKQKKQTQSYQSWDPDTRREGMK